MKNVPFLDLKRTYSEYGEEIEEAIIRVLRSGIYLNGEETASLEKELANYIGVNFAVGVSSGTEALYLILKALEPPQGSCVLLPSFTFVSTAEVVVRAGLIPVFVDVEPDTPNIAINSLVETYRILKISGKKIFGVIAVSIFGIPARLPEIAEFCNEEKIFLIEDICQAFGSEIENKKVGSFGIASATSFYPTKSLSACGDGGMVFTNNEALYKKIKILKEHGQIAPYFYAYHGINGRIDEVQCAILRVKFKYFPKEVQLRKKLAEFYFQELAFCPVKMFQINASIKPVFSVFSIKVKERDELKQFLESKGISTKIYYPKPLHKQPIFTQYKVGDGVLPETERLCQEVLSLPFFPYLSLEEAKYVVEKIKEFYDTKL
ncbi:MAG: DegT/DnrJ/EryC1/StrS family aminotransferase [Caldimicrobium sp.]